MPRQIVIIDGHPDADAGRFCHALADAYARGAVAAGHGVDRVALAALDIPLLHSRREFYEGTTPPDVAAVQEALRRADHLVLVYPLWLGTMPALVKAFLEQLLRPGFALTDDGGRWPRKRLAGLSARIVVTMGMPAFWYRWFYLSHSLKSLERNILKFCGIKPVRETLFGMVEGASEMKRAAWLSRMEDLGRRGA